MKPASIALVVVTAGIMAVAPDALAQKRTNPSPSRPSTGLDPSRDRDIRDRSIRMQHIDDAANKEKRTDPKLLLKQIRDDFVRLQELNNQLLQAASKAPLTSPEEVVKAAGEVNERARRLQVNLALPPPPQKSGKEDVSSSTTPVDVVKQISELDESITTFVTNPMFRTLEVLDSKLAADASASLQRIVESSQKLQRDTDQLRRPQQRK